MSSKNFYLALALAGALATAAPAVAEDAGNKETTDEVEAQSSRESTAALQAWVRADEVYRSNCVRCHRPPRNLSSGKMVTVLRHMRVRANLTEDDYRDLLLYLASPGAKAGR